MENGSKLAKVLVIFLVAIFAFGVSNCVALLTNGFVNLDFLNSADDASGSLNIFELNKTSNDSSQSYYNDSNTSTEFNNDKGNSNNNNNGSNNNVDEGNNVPVTEPKPPQDNTQIESIDQN